MEREITTNVFSSEMEDSLQDNFALDSNSRHPENIFIDRPSTSNTDITQVNGHHLPDDDEEDEEEDDLVLGDEDDLDDEDLKEDEIDVEIDDDLDEEDIDEDDLVLDADDEDEEESDL